jgi:hypothetical protein
MFHHSLVRKIVALQCQEVGFEAINGDALEELTILYMQCSNVFDNIDSFFNITDKDKRLC